MNEDELKLQITEMLKKSIQSQLLNKQYLSRGYDGIPKKSNTSNNRVYTGRLYNSVDVEFVRIKPDELERLQVSFPNAPEWYWVNYGRKGKKQDASNKYPPLASIDRWVVSRKGVSQNVRDRQGRFIERKSLVFLIQRSIGYYGTYQTNFVQNAFNAVRRQLVEELGEYAREYFENVIERRIILGPIQVR